MSVERRPPSLETSSLLAERPPSYNSTDDVNSSRSPTLCDPEPTPINQFSNADICWILGGLWSGVLLGAFDGMPSYHSFLFRAPHIPPQEPSLPLC